MSRCEVGVVGEGALDHAFAGRVVERRVLLIEDEDVGVGGDRGRQVRGRQAGRQGVASDLKRPPDVRRRRACTEHEHAPGDDLVTGTSGRSEREHVVDRDYRCRAAGVADDEPLLGLTGDGVDDAELEAEFARAATVGEHVEADRRGQRRRQRHR